MSNNTQRNYRRYETMRNPSQPTQPNPVQPGTQPHPQTGAEYTQTNRQPTQPYPPEGTGYTQTARQPSQRTAANPQHTGRTRAAQPPGVTQPAPSYGDQPTGGYSAGYTGYQAPIPSALPPQRPAQAARRRSQNGVSAWLIAAILGVIGMVGALMMVALIVVAAVSPERIESGVRVAGFDVGGLTYQEAASAVAAVPELQIALVDGSRSFQVRLSDLGGSVDTAATLESVKAAGRDANVLPVIMLDLAQTQFGLIALSDTINIDAVPGNPPQIGRSMEIPVMLDRLRTDPTGELADGIFELNMIEIVPPPPLTGVNANPDARTVHVVERGQELALIARQYGVTLDDILYYNEISDPDLIYVGQELVIPAAGEYVPVSPPPAPLQQGKSIVVSVADQRIYAYENGQLVRSHLTSTGLSETPTVLGDYRIYVKYQATDMSGPGYFLPQVPYTMYFYQGYGIHGTYWHNSFGRPMSHGCVNLPTDEAQWFFNWAEVGTLVRVI